MCGTLPFIAVNDDSSTALVILGATAEIWAVNTELESRADAQSNMLAAVLKGGERGKRIDVDINPFTGENPRKNNKLLFRSRSSGTKPDCWQIHLGYGCKTIIVGHLASKRAGLDFPILKNAGMNQSGRRFRLTSDSVTHDECKSCIRSRRKNAAENPAPACSPASTTIDV
jgi:hypothetical protein